MSSTSQSDTSPLDLVLVHHVRDAWVTQASVDDQWAELGYTDRPRFEAARAEADAFVAALCQSGARVELVGPDCAGLDAIYTRDASVVTDAGAILCRMGKASRRAEPAAQARIFERLGIPILGAISGEGTLEGGDTTWLDSDTLAVGRGYRTNEAGIRQLRSLLPSEIELVTVALPHYRGPGDVFHLMSIISPIDRDLALVYSPLMPVPFRELLLERGYQLVEVPDEELDSLGGNCLALGPRRCLLPAGNPETRARLEAAGAEVTEFAGEEISKKGCGGPTCLTRPLRRRL